MTHWPYCDCQYRRKPFSGNMPHHIEKPCEEHPECAGRCLVPSHKPTDRRVLWERAADQIPLEKRQQFIDLMTNGKNLGEAREIMGFEFEVAMVLVDRQIEGHTYHTFNKEVNP